MGIKHGTAGGYTNDACRCVPCTQAGTSIVMRRRRERYAWVAEHGLPDSVAHGRSAYQNWGCRCAVCTRDASAKKLADKQRGQAR